MLAVINHDGCRSESRVRRSGAGANSAAFKSISHHGIKELEIITIIAQLAKSRPEMNNFNLNDFIAPSILKEIENSGFVNKLYGK